MSTRARRIALSWLFLSCTLIVLVSPLPYFTTPLHTLAENGFGLAWDFVGRAPVVRVALYLHAGSAGLALLLSPLQLLGRFRRDHPGLHRAVGRTVLASILVAAPAGLVLVPGNHAGLIGVLGFGILDLLWTTFAVLALRAARHGDISTHRRWATRTFAMTYAAVTLRAWLLLLTALQVGIAGVADGTAFDRAYLLVPFLCWVPNLVLVERLMSRAWSSPGGGGLQQAADPQRHHLDQ